MNVILVEWYLISLEITLFGWSTILLRCRYNNIIILFVHKYLMLNFIFYSILDIAALLLLVVFVLTGVLWGYISHR